jgi:hypothetical protein
MRVLKVQPGVLTLLHILSVLLYGNPIFMMCSP